MTASLIPIAVQKKNHFPTTLNKNWRRVLPYFSSDPHICMYTLHLNNNYRFKNLLHYCYILTFTRSKTLQPFYIFLFSISISKKRTLTFLPNNTLYFENWFWQRNQSQRNICLTFYNIYELNHSDNWIIWSNRVFYYWGVYCMTVLRLIYDYYMLETYLGSPTLFTINHGTKGREKERESIWDE